MGVSSLVNRVTYSGDGSTQGFSFPYYYFLPADIVVYLYNIATGVPYLAILGSDYTITATANAQGLYPSGGTVNFTTAPTLASATAGQIVVIFRNPAFKQNYALLQNGVISSAALVQQLDYVTLLAQRLEDQINNNCIQVQDGIGPGFSPVLQGSPLLSPTATLQVTSDGSGVTFLPGANFAVATIGYAALSASALTKSVALFTLPAGAVLGSLFIKHTTAFVGTSITGLTANVLVTGSPPMLLNFNLLASVSDTAWDSVFANFLSSWANQTTISLAVTAVGANLSALSAGSVNVYYNWLTV